MTTRLISRAPTEEMLMTANRCYMDGGDIEDTFLAMFDAAPTVNPWVGVKERLPKKPDYYWVFADGSKDGAFLQADGTFTKTVTHWWDTNIMSIPRPEET